MGFLSGVLGTNNGYQARRPVNGFQATSNADPASIVKARQQSTGGAGPASDTIQRQNMLSDQLTAAAAGQGPNPALEQLKQTTSENVNRAAGTAASTKGANAALAMRTAVDAGSTANQAAAGQAATMSAQQQIAARQQLGQNLSATGATQLGQQEAGTDAYRTAGALDMSAQGMNEQVAGQNASLDLGTQQLQAGISSQNASTNAGLVGGLINGAGAVLAAADGGMVPDMPGGPLHDYLDVVHGPVSAPSPYQQFSTPVTGDQNAVPFSPAVPPGTGGAGGGGAKAAGKGLSAAGDAIGAGGEAGAAAFRQMTARPVLGASFAHGGSIHAPVPVAVSPGEKVVPPGTTPSRAAQMVRSAPPVPGQARVAGDSPANDTVHARLPAGSIVIPRSIVHSKNPGKAASSFVASVLKRGGGKYAGGAVGPKSAPGPGPESMLDMSEGGLVGHHPPEPQSKGAEKPSTGRGVARERMRGRIKRSDKPLYREAD